MRALTGFWLCLVGMMAGLAIDCLATPPELIASLCIRRSSIVAELAAHWATMPASFVGMVAGGALVSTRTAFAAWRTTGSSRAVGGGLCIDIACLSGMLCGMILAAYWAPFIPAGAGPSARFAGLVLAMAACMLLGLGSVSAMTYCVAAGVARLRRVARNRRPVLDPVC